MFDFLTKLRIAFEEKTLHKCTLSRPGNALPADLKNIYIRRVDLKKGPHWAFTYRFKTRDEVKNFPLEAGLSALQEALGRDWLHADLFTSKFDLTLSFDKNGQAKSSLKAPSTAQAPDLRHDREKQRLLDPAAPWLHALGISNGKGEILPSAQDKWKQINKYLEIIETLIREFPREQSLVIADMGSGKGYLTFALYDMLQRRQGAPPRLTGIELRQNLVDFCNKVAQDNHFDGLKFIAADISAYQPERLDMLIALHACDTATDLALATGMRLNAPIIVAAPCCHKQIRREMQAQNELAPLLEYGILAERQAEMLTDGIRALLLESQGWHSKVFEFISTEHTAKNVMITAQKTPGTRVSAAVRQKSLAKVEALKKGFGIREHFLETLIYTSRH